MLTIAQESAFPNPRRRWATLTSFILQAAVVAVVLALPLLQPSLLPSLDFTPRLVPIFLPHVEAPSAPHPPSGAPAVQRAAWTLTAPSSIPKVIDASTDTTRPDPAPCMQCFRGTNSTPGVPGGMDVIALAVPPGPPKPIERPLRVSRMMDGLLIHRVQPDYPIFAKQHRIQGPVEIAALISKEGAIENLHVLSGPPMLIPAALQAVQQWRYRPYVLNGDPIEVDTRITVIFSLGEN